MWQSVLSVWMCKSFCVVQEQFSGRKVWTCRSSMSRRQQRKSRVSREKNKGSNYNIELNHSSRIKMEVPPQDQGRQQNCFKESFLLHHATCMAFSSDLDLIEVLSNNLICVSLPVAPDDEMMGQIFPDDCWLSYRESFNFSMWCEYKSLIPGKTFFLLVTIK